jgi:hypothetical protein
MNRNVAAQTNYDRLNKGVDVRNSSTANFLIDSADRAGYNNETVANIGGVGLVERSANFTISKLGQNLVSGFFTRFTMSEIELEWNIQNVTLALENNFANFGVINTGTGAITLLSALINQGNYTVKDALDALVARMSAVSGLAFTIVDSTTLPGGIQGKKAILAPVGYQFTFYRLTPVPASPAPFLPSLAQNLGFVVRDTPPTVPAQFGPASVAYKPNMLPYKYIDITCSQLASQQKVKDATTSAFDSIDVIYRWVFANDEAVPTTYDAYGYPIIQGYLPFNARRTISFPKQIRWDPLVPVGNLTFQVYTDQEQIMKYFGLAEAMEFKMLMLISEV